MRKLQRLAVIMLLWAAALAVPVACGDDGGPELGALVGTWTLTRYVDCEYDSGLGEWGTLTIQSSGAYTYEEDGFTSEGTIRVSGNNLIMTWDGETSTARFTLSGDTLVMIDDENPDCPNTTTFVRG